MRTGIHSTAQFIYRFWQLLRRLSGDDAYERYLQHLQQQHPNITPMNRRNFYLSEQQRRWNGGPNRCC